MAVSKAKGNIMKQKANSTVIRAAEISDAPAIATLSEQLGYEVDPSDMKRRLALALEDCEQAVFVAQNDDGEVIGWASVLLYKSLVISPMALVGGLVVEKTYRRQGIGASLLAACEAWAKSNNCEAIRAHSSITRKEAHIFYAAKEYDILRTQYVLRKELNKSR